MERPDLSKIDKETVKYIESIERKLGLFTSDTTTANFYLGLKKHFQKIDNVYHLLN